MLLLTSSLLLYRWRFFVDIVVMVEVRHFDLCTWSGWLLSDLYLYKEAGYGGFGVGGNTGWHCS